MKYMLPLSFRRTITKLWQLPYIVFVMIIIFSISIVRDSTVQVFDSLTPNVISHIPDWWLQNLWQQFRHRIQNPPMTYSWWYRINDIILLCATIFASFFFGSIIKYCYYKPRPEPQKYTNRWQKIDASSFPSIHTANSLILVSFGLMASGGLVIQNAPIRQQFVVQLVLPLFWILFYITISYSRIVLKKHFWIDLVGGTIFGSLIVAWVIWQADMIIMIVWNVSHLVLK